MKKAKEILKAEEDFFDEQEEYIKTLIIVLCLKYNFRYKFVNDSVFIYSIIDEWYFCYMKEKIVLLHRNKIKSRNQFHFQKKFNNIVYALQYIKKHDNYNYKARTIEKKN